MRLAIGFLFTVLAINAQAPPRRIAVIAHRGEHLAHVENTMAAFEAAQQLGADFVEADVRTTADGKLVLMHDSRVDRTTNGTGEVSKMNFDEIRRLDAKGNRVPTFAELLDYAARVKLGVYVDCKSISARDLVDHLKSSQMTEQVVVYGAKTGCRSTRHRASHPVDARSTDRRPRFAVDSRPAPKGASVRRE